MDLINHVRAYHYLAGVLTIQQGDHFCRRCSAWSNTLNNTREALGQFAVERTAELQGLPPEEASLLAEVRSRIATLVSAENPTGQKKAGNCRLPAGVCFVKSSRTLLEKV